MYILKIDVNEMLIKEFLYSHYNNEDRVNREYLKLSKESYHYSKNESRNIAMQLHEYCSLNYDKNLLAKKYLSEWKKKHTDLLLDDLGLTYETVKTCLKFHKHFAVFLNNLFRNTENNYLLTWKEYKHVNSLFLKLYSFERYEALRSLFFKTVKKLKNTSFVSDQTHVVKTIFKSSKPHLCKYYDVVYLKDMEPFIKKIQYYMKESKVYVCACSEPHTNFNVIDATIATVTTVCNKLKYREPGKYVIECYDNKLYFDFYKSLLEG